VSLLVSKRIIPVTIIVFLVGLCLGYLYLPYIIPREVPRAKDLVGLIEIEGYVVSPEALYKYINIINQAITNESIKAVVLSVNSGGGYANYIEQIYHDLLKLKEKKTLVASIVTALSGGYYIAVAADRIYALPTSLVGNIGVIGTGPPVLIPSEVVLETGAYKATGFSMLLFPHNLSRALENFASAVEAGRGSKLKLTSKELRRGLIYLGSEALRAGLVDDLGSLQMAIDEAARKAGLERFEVVRLKPQEGVQDPSQTYRGYASNGSITLDELNRLHPPPAIHYIYLPPQTMTQSPPIGSPTTSAGGGWDAIIDASHGNMVSWWDLNILIAELASKNITVSFLSSWEDIESMLDNAHCLIVASPTKPYSPKEIEKVEGFVNKGGLLLLFFDPSWEYLGMEGLSHGIVAPINSLSHKFTLTFGKGYLYNEDENYGIYRNIYIRNFAESPITQNLRTIVFFTATHIYPSSRGVAWASNLTYSSVSERTGSYATIAFVRWGNGTVAAFADITFLSEPWCYIEDNYQLLLKIASLVAETKAKAETKPTLERAEWKIEKPNLPVRTEKIYTEWINGEEKVVRWLKVSETEVLVERPERVIHYYYDENGSLIMWRSDNMSVVYRSPIPETPYPLTKGKKWRHESGYILNINSEKLEGRLIIEEEVVDFEEIRMEAEIKYFCAKVKYTMIDEITQKDTIITITSTGHYWVSSEVGDVKDESDTITYINGLQYRIERRKLLLKEIRKGR